MKSILSSKVIETKNILWRQAKWFQNEELKDISEESLQALKESLVSNDFIMPFHVWQHGETIWILDGHHRQKALLELLNDSVEIPEYLPATFIDCQDEKEAAKYVLIYSSIYAKIQNDGLDAFLQMYELDLNSFKTQLDIPDFSLPRFEQKFIFDNIDDEEEEITELDETIVSPGDIFQLGPHKIYCGDCEELVNLMGGKKADLIYTDPPYNLPADYIGNKGATKHKDFAEAKGEMTDEEFKDWLEQKMNLMCAISKEVCFHFIWMDFRHVWHMCEAAKNVYGSPMPKQICVWNKDRFGNGDFYRAKHEFCLIFKKGKGKHYSALRLVDRIRTNIWDYPSGNSRANIDLDQIKNHPTPKPTIMARDAIIDVTKDGELVVDLFLGSGSTLIGADMAGRICYGSEIEPHFCQNIILRWINHCQRENKPIDFNHLNGNLTLKSFIDG